MQRNNTYPWTRRQTMTCEKIRIENPHKKQQPMNRFSWWNCDCKVVSIVAVVVHK